jgi:hypothetical protein
MEEQNRHNPNHPHHSELPDLEAGGEWPPKPAAQLTQADVERLKVTGMKIFQHIADAWGLTKEQRNALLGGEEILSSEQLERVSLLMGIFKDLHTLLPTTADSWVHRPNSKSLFNGGTPISLLSCSGTEGMQKVKTLLSGLIN